jgi:hypothetical protein
MPVLLIHALIWIIIVLVLAYVIVLLLNQIPGLPSIIPTLVWIVAVLICLIVLLTVLLPGAMKIGALDIIYYG